MAALGRGGLIVAVLVLPFTIPVLIFGVSAASAVIVGPTPFLPPFLILLALTLISAVIAPLAGAAALRAAPNKPYLAQRKSWSFAPSSFWK